MRILIAAMACAATAALSAPVAEADFGLQRFDTAVTSSGAFSRQAGEHADLTTTLKFSGNESIRDATVVLPPGMVGNPNATDRCTMAELVGLPNTNYDACPKTAQIGTVDIDLIPNDPSPRHFPVFNMVQQPDLPALFAFNYSGVVVRIEPRLRPTDYAISATVKDTSTGQAVNGASLTFWGVPADPIHDADRGGQPNPSPRRPFLTNPTSCPSTPTAFTARVDSWQNSGVFTDASVDSDSDGTPYLWEGCKRLAFNPSITVDPGSHKTDSPSGLSFDLSVPQSDDPYGLATAQVRKTVVRFPEGMSVSPSSANGLGACSSAQIAMGTDLEPQCPESSKLGTVSIDTPLLQDPLDGDVILAAQDDNPFHSLLALYLVVRGPGVLVKIPGRVDADAVTGQLTATFDNTPQLPFSHLRVALRGGPTAPLATPTACGTYTTHAEVTSWASPTPVSLDAPMVIDQGCERRDFNPSLSAGTASTVAGADTSFRFAATRADGSAYLSRLDAVLPAGLLARIGSVPLCPEADAAAGTCTSASDIGSTSVLSGPGALPLPLTGRVFLTGPYKDAPFGLSIVVQTRGQAGPFDLGAVVVRAGIYVDRTDAHATVKSDPLPTILDGFPLRLRQVVVNIDRPGFIFNPTSCAAKSIFAGFESTDGNSLTRDVPFQATGCGELPVSQKVALSLTGKTSTTDGTHPGIHAKVTSPAGAANLKTVSVALPLSLALDPDNAEQLCKPEQRDALQCPAKSIVGSVTARSVLPDPLTGPVYFVEGLRKSASGRTIRTLPKLWIPLSGDGVTIDVNASSEVRQGRLVTTFDKIPDAPIESFDMSIAGGKHGIIVVSGKPGTCDRAKAVDGMLTGQNDVSVRLTTNMAVEGCKPAVKSKKATSRALTVTVTNVGAGRLAVEGTGVRAASRTLKAATEATLTLKWTAATARALRRHHVVRVKLTTTFRSRSGGVVRGSKTLGVHLNAHKG